MTEGWSTDAASVLQAERDRYRAALVEIADAQSGVWGQVARAALHPRRAGWFAQAANGDLPPRDLVFERSWTIQAAAIVHADAERLIAFAEIRAGGGPVLGLPDRDLGRELREELADARNYAVWFAQDVVRRADGSDLPGEITEAIGQSLAAVVAAFDHAARAGDLMTEWKAQRR